MGGTLTHEQAVALGRAGGKAGKGKPKKQPTGRRRREWGDLRDVAVGTLQDLLASELDLVRFHAAKFLIERAEGRAPLRVHHTGGIGVALSTDPVVVGALKQLEVAMAGAGGGNGRG